MAEDRLPLLDRTLAEPRHLLVLPGAVTLDEVEALAASHFDDAGWTGPSSLRVTGAAQLTGPWQLDDALRTALDLPRWAVLAMLLRCPIERSGPVPRELLGLGGLLDAFPDGEPVGLEGRVLRHLLAQARRLGGAVRLAGTGTVLVPDPATAVDLTVHSTVWLDPDACAQVLAPQLPTLRLPHDEAPLDGATQPAGAEASVGPAAHRPPPGALDENERAWLHAEADALDRAVLAQPQVLDGYALVGAPRRDGALAAGDSADGDLIEIGVSGDVPPEPALRAMPWARNGVVTYEVRWRPADPESALGPRPPLAGRRRRTAARLLVERLTALLHGAVGGEVVDDDGFLVAVGSLADGRDE
ncbi:hypothetical protein [Georgenia sp. MJ170]|uniref:hypothetical protein n=1 Tax=Georgenia sunbinii TaxID=3117728 RepID=UPI002F265494